MNNSNKKAFTIYFLLIFLFANIFAQNNHKNIFKNTINQKTILENYTTQQGLSQNAVYEILQDNIGFIWFGTQDGLNRFNGNDFTIFHHYAFDTTSISHSFINGIYEDSQNRLWICTEGGLSLFKKSNETFINYFHDDENPESINDNYVWTILEDTQGIYWVGTKKRLQIFDSKSGKFNPIEFLNQSNIKNYPSNIDVIFEDENGNIWIGSRGLGLYKIVRNMESRNFSIEHFELENSDVRSIIQHTDGSIFIGTFGAGLYKYNSAENKFYNISKISSNSLIQFPKKIISLFEDPNNPNILWIGTEQNGIVLFNTNLKEITEIKNNPKYPKSLSGNMVYNIFKDRSGIIWLGTNEGINKVNLSMNSFEHIQREEKDEAGLSSNTIGKIIEDDQGILWIGSDGGGLNKLDRKTNTYSNFRHNKNNSSSISSDRALIVFEDSNNIIWVGTYGGGLNKFNKNTNTFSSFVHNPNDTTSIGSNYITSIVEDKNGILWIGTTQSGINSFNPKTNKFRSYKNNPKNPESISDNHLWILYLDSDQTLWAGTKSGGLNKLIDKEKGIFKKYLHDDKLINGINHNSVHALYEDNLKNFWIGTPAGLIKLDTKTDEFTNYQYNGIFPQFRVIGILEDNQNRLWIMSEKSLIRFNPQNNRIKYFDDGNGMMINDFRIWAYFKNKKGELFVGGANGFAIFNPDNLIDNSYIPPVVIDKFERFNTDNLSGYAISEKGIAYQKGIELSYKDNIFSFSFSALNFINSSKNQYSYKLEGFNKEWINIGNQNKVTFTNIDPGEYNFLVRGSNDDGIWNDEGTSLAIIISPPFWGTWWFRIGSILIIVLSIGSLIRNKIIKVKKHHQEQEAFARQLIETEELERQRIANELHDGLGQNLLVIKNSILVKQQQEFIEGKSLLEMSELVSQTIHEVRSISHNLRPHLLDQLGLSKTIKSLAKQINEIAAFNLEFEIDDLKNSLEAKAEINLFRIIQECFNNIIKHADAENVFLSIKKMPNDLHVSIKDDGKGMNLEETLKREDFGDGFGLNGMKKRAHVFNWKFEIESELGKGTEIKLTIPNKRNN